VDGCRVHFDGTDCFPALEAYRRFRNPDEKIELLVWTHPHADHFDGIRECVEEESPERIAMAHDQGALARSELEAAGTHPLLPRDLKLAEVFRRVGATFQVIYDRWERVPRSRVPLSAEAERISIGSVDVRAHAPRRVDLERVYALESAQLRSALKERANELSIVLELKFGATRVLLGGDLPESRGGASITGGWLDVCEAEPCLAQHTLLKVPHHGSVEAIPSAFDRRPDREWIVTPFVRQGLPRPGDDATGGLRVLLQRTTPIRLTSACGLASPAEPGATVLRQALRDAKARAEAAGLAGGVRSTGATDPLDFSWCVAFDHTGKIVERYAGAQAISVVEDS